MKLLFKPTSIITVLGLLLATIFIFVTTASSASAATTTEKRSEVLRLVNIQRVKHGCGKLVLNTYLNKAAQTHTDKMGAANKMSHQLSGESGLGTRITRAGYTHWRGVGENIAYGYSTPATVMSAWMKSPGHRANILNCKYKHLGVGVKYAHGKWWWTQDFGYK